VAAAVAVLALLLTAFAAWTDRRGEKAEAALTA
jgi:uncharacterized protein involved in response to NO